MSPFYPEQRPFEALIWEWEGKLELWEYKVALWPWNPKDWDARVMSGMPSSRPPHADMKSKGAATLQSKCVKAMASNFPGLAPVVCMAYPFHFSECKFKLQGDHCAPDSNWPDLLTQRLLAYLHGSNTLIQQRIILSRFFPQRKKWLDRISP